MTKSSTATSRPTRDLKNFPLLMHIVDILDKGMADADLPWESFTFEQFR